MHYLKLCFLIDSIATVDKQNMLLSALKGGITAVQLRNKSEDLNVIYNQAIEFKKLLAPFNVPLIINDYLEIAKETDADGLHLGQTDIDFIKARKILGDNKIIGLSIESLDNLKDANNYKDISYIAASSVFKSTSKKNIKTIWEIEGLRKIVKLSHHKVIAIGGINENNIKEVLATGVSGVAVISAISKAQNPMQTASKLLNEIKNAKLN